MRPLIYNANSKNLMIIFRNTFVRNSVTFGLIYLENDENERRNFIA